MKCVAKLLNALFQFSNGLNLKVMFFLMPHIECGNQKMRINHCPSCGKEVRSIELTEEEMKKLLSL